MNESSHCNRCDMSVTTDHVMLSFFLKMFFYIYNNNKNQTLLFMIYLYLIFFVLLKILFYFFAGVSQNNLFLSPLIENEYNTIQYNTQLQIRVKPTFSVIYSTL